ncbi:glycosyltransferase [Bacteroides sp. An269]|uniref:glycosyltransferase n=1 Tax=Bacteroides sp. An269 TaxID=1965613 RepID=UPI000B3A1B05|nr:glycosyltransferase [Bacteroides sp. An269]OUO81860.1 glycosyl transferase family 2 [Bacteroides sp. An269]
MKAVEVSVVIVCMNNIGNLYPCLNSILKNTTVNYEIFVVAFLFSEENLQKLHSDFPTVKIIISNELRGFSENNNLALKQAVGKYCFVVNDDTYFSDPVIDKLVEDFNKVDNNVAIISPVTLNSDGSVQRCGKPKYNLFTYWLYWMKLICLYENNSKYTNGKGLFQTYNISGACFLIKTELFKKIGWFDERYYFCPEDIALSTYLNKNGYKCYVDSTIKLTHTGGGSWSKTMYATKPAQIKGEIIFYGEKSFLHKMAVRILLLVFLPIYSLMWKICHSIRKDEKSKVFSKAYLNGLKAIFTDKTPKELFVQFYKSDKK